MKDFKDFLRYVRTDRNGTKIYEDYMCPRCMGEGQADNWKFTGLVCFRCGGTGKRTKPVIYREYTEEYLAKLDARRKEKAEKYAEEHAEEIAAKKAEQERKEEENRKYENAQRSKALGLGETGIGFVYTGNTYPVKEKIKAVGGRWISQAWVAPEAIELKGCNTFEINANDFINDYGFVNTVAVRDVIYAIGNKHMDYEDAKEYALSY